ncbi:MAG: phosphohistidine phosphatase SixA [Deltaproteobacteria bacterium]|nr:phosphohistidine phosphatase SixA [Deltaproteobacteria bacterium]
MEFYLTRHGEAKAEHEDRSRPLSDRGKRQVEEVGEALAQKGIEVSEILHSDKLRAKQTAEILARHLSLQDRLRRIDGLAPSDDPVIAKAELETAGGSLMLVGHLPHLSRLASLLLIGDPEREIVDFPTAAVVCLSREEGNWQVSWTLAPDAG